MIAGEFGSLEEAKGSAAMLDERRNFSVYVVDLITLLAGRKERLPLLGQSKRLREIHSVCMFTLCIENDIGTRYMIGFPVRGRETAVVPFDRFFDDDFAQLQDVDFVMVEVPKSGPLPGSAKDHRLRSCFKTYVGGRRFARIMIAPKSWKA
jgi:hypothetical protein